MNEVLITVSGLTGSGKSAIAGEIEIALKAIGVPVLWEDSPPEKNASHADWKAALDLYQPHARIQEINIARIPPSYFGSDTLSQSKQP